MKMSLNLLISELDSVMRMYYIILLMLFLCGCKFSDKDNDTEQIRKLYSERSIAFDDSTEFCIVLPEVGCAGCISGALYNILENKSSFSNGQKKNLIVFTAVNSRKMLLRNMQVDSFSELNCIVDLENKYLLETNDKIYPIMMTIKNGKVTKAIIQSPDNPEDAFIKLYKAK